jgi:hypothetical protein
MKNIYYAKIQKEKSGITNQLVVLLSSFILARQENKKIVIVDNFLNDYSSETYSNISKILDVPTMNVYLKNKYNLIMIDRYHVNFKILSIKYGLNDTTIDITNELIEKCYTDNKLFISNKLNLNSIKYDPCPGQGKKLYITYFINDNIFEEIYNEMFNCLVDNIVFNLDDKDIYLHRFHWINYLDRTMFDDILRNIVYNKYFICMSNKYTSTLNKNNKINVLHLRLEPDAIEYWSRMNNMEQHIFKKCIENKYINIIKNHINKTDNNIILSYFTDNNVVDYLRTNNYKYCFVPKIFSIGRELNAIIDLLVAENCNNIFVGNFHVNKLNGSTFSYFILQKLYNTSIKKIMLDLDHIMHEPSVGYNSI